MISAEYDWSYIRSELNANDMHMVDGRLLVLYNSFVVEYDISGNEVSRYDLKLEHNLSFVRDFEVDSKNNIWLFGDSGAIYVLDQSYRLIENFTYLDVDKLNRCLDTEIDNEDYYLCTYIKDSELGILSFSYDSVSSPVYEDYFVIDQGVIPDEVIVDLDETSENIFLSTNEGVYYASKESNLKLPDSWSICANSQNVLASISMDKIFIFSSDSDLSIINILDQDGNQLQTLEYNSSDFIDIIQIDENLIGLLLKQEIALLSYDSDSDQFTVDSSYPLDGSEYTSISY